LPQIGSNNGPNAGKIPDWVGAGETDRAAIRNSAVLGESDPSIRQRLQASLAAHEQSERLWAAATRAATLTMKRGFPDQAPEDTVGQTLGRYKVLEKIGEGGCGVVYVAEQTEPVRRHVALKVIKLSMDTKQVVVRTVVGRNRRRGRQGENQDGATLNQAATH
jgi:eukaryotic-like serine/threonine-protein kinase